MNYFGENIPWPEISFTPNCPSGCCFEAIPQTYRYFLDGVEEFCGGNYCGPTGFINVLSNGGHSILNYARVLNYPDATAYINRTYSFGFNVDNDSPNVSIISPENNAVVSTSNVSIGVNISDMSSKLEIARFALSAIETSEMSGANATMPSPACFFKKELSDIAISTQNPVHDSEAIYCSPRLSSAALAECTANLITAEPLTLLSKTYDLKDYVDFSGGRDCSISINAVAMDRVGNSTGTTGITFIVDQAAPVIEFSSWPVAFSSESIKSIGGTAYDASEIQYLKLSLAQIDWKGTTTYWGGGDWTDDEGSLISISIPASTNTFNWSYTDLLPEKMISGSHYILRLYSEDQFNHKAIVQKEFDYNICSYAVEHLSPSNTEKKFEVGDAVFRAKLNTYGLGYLGLKHTGIYVVSDSKYEKYAGTTTLDGSTTTFVNALSKKPSLKDILNSDGQHYIVHANGHFVEGVKFSDFVVEENKYRGARTSKTILDAQTRDRIAYNASLQLGKPYHWRDQYWAGGKPSEGNLVSTAPVGFRCDGLVVYSYVKADVLDVIPGGKGLQGDWTVMSPNDLFYTYMAEARVDTPSKPEVSVAADGEKFTISVVPQDISSGIDSVQHYLYARTNGFLSQGLLSEDDTDSIASHVYTSTCGCNPGKNIVTRLVDRAGNWTLYDSSLHQMDISSPSTPTPPLEPDSHPMLAGPVVSTKNNSLTYNITSIVDDITLPFDMKVFYHVDQSFEDWDDDAKTATVVSGLAQGNFAVAPGTHKLYAAVMDESANFSTVVNEFKVPGFASSALGSGARVIVDNVALRFDNLTNLASVSANNTIVADLPSGYSNLPQPLSKEITIDGAFQGGFFVVMNYANYGVTAVQEPYLQMAIMGKTSPLPWTQLINS